MSWVAMAERSPVRLRKQVGRRQAVDLVEEPDPHAGQQAKRHVVGEPRFKPVQHPGEWCCDGKPDQEAGPGLPVGDAGHHEGGEYADADEADDAAYAKDEGRQESHALAGDEGEKDLRCTRPAQALGAQDAVCRFGLGGSPGRHVPVPFRGRRLLADRDEVVASGQRLGGLLVHEREVDAAAFHEIVVGPLLDDPALAQDKDPVGPDDARQAMGENERRAVLHEAEQSLLDDRLVLGIDGRERLVEHEDGRIAQHGAGDGDPLALAAGEPDAALADHRLVAGRQGGDEVVGIGVATGLLHLSLWVASGLPNLRLSSTVP